MIDNDRYPVGQQDFKTLRERGALYIDKTAFIEKIANSMSQYYFLARPRRFGKSLFLSTLRYFFEAKRHLFKGLHIDSTDWNWEPYPVLYLDLNTDRFAQEGMLEAVLERHFRNWEEKYGITVKEQTYSQRFAAIIEAAHSVTGKQVVILVDEYDKALSLNLNNDALFEHYRTRLASIYSNFKSSAEHIRLVFLTGISRFGKLSVFSDLNNLNDISFDDAYSDICGITETELIAKMSEGIEALASRSRMTVEETISRLKRNYDGYRFAPEGSDIYNPWSLLSCLQKGRIGTYWNNTGASTIAAEALRHAHVDIEHTLNASWNLDDLAGLDLLNVDPTAMLYQAGYLTIADYDWASNRVRLKVPNEEVQKGLFNGMLEVYLRPKGNTIKRIIDDIFSSIHDGRPEKMMRYLDAYFASVPYDLKIDNENNFQNAFYILTTLIGIDSKAEAHTSDGRIDLLIESSRYVYIIELKYDSAPEIALHQIEEKEYARRYAMDSRKVFLIGVNFSSAHRRIDGWLIK